MSLKVNQQQLAKLLGKDPTTIARFQRQGMPYLPRETNGKAATYFAPAAINWVFGHRWCGQAEVDAEPGQKVAIGFFLSNNEKDGADQVAELQSLLKEAGLKGSAEQLMGFASGITAAQG